MATSLTLAQRGQLDGIVQKMQANGETDAYIQGVVNDFKVKYSAPTTSPFRPIDAVGAAMGGPGRGLLKLAAKPGTIPNVAGFLGGIGGGAMGLAMGPAAPLAVPAGRVSGSMVAGAAGQGIEDALLGRPVSMERMALEGGRQGSYEVLGAGFGRLAGAAGRGIGPIASKVARMGRNPIARELSRASRLGLPLGGALTHGVPGALAGVALPLAGRAALRVAMSPKTEAFLASRAFRLFVRQHPRAAAQLYQQMVLTEQPDATQSR